jgi:hypothetical protein
MSNSIRITSASQLNSVIFRDHATEPIRRRFVTLFPGMAFAATYKVLQRAYKYGTQPIIHGYLSKHHGDSFDDAFGTGIGKTMVHATAGSLIGVSEIILLPLDVLKIKRQTNPGAFHGHSLRSIIQNEGSSLYRGWCWTAARNASGSFALFGGFAAAKQYLFVLGDYNSATGFQNLVASGAGVSASLIVAAPLDVIKTRIQSRDFSIKERGTRIAIGMLRKEGPGAFFKGLVPKLLTIGPKSTLSFWLAQTLATVLNGVL